MTKWLATLVICLSIATGGHAEESDPQQADDWLVGGFDTQSKWITAGLTIGLGAYLATADTADIRDLGDLTQFIPGAFGLTSSLLTGDREGLKQFGWAAATTLVATHGLKQIVDKSRPDGSEDNSFPSGHTSASAMGAAYVWRRYGAKWGAPASVLVAYTGASRVRGQKHFTDDVISGAAIGLLSNLLWTDPIDERVRMSLLPLEDGAGLQIEYDPSAPGAPDSYGDLDEVPSHYFLWEFGVSDVSQNDVAAPNPGGTLVDWRFDGENNPTATGFVSVGWSLTPTSRHGVYGALSPFEVREGFQVADDIDFGGELFLAGNEARSRYVSNDYRVGYGYDVVAGERLNLSLHGSLAIFDTLVELRDESVSASVDETLLKPVIGARLMGTLSNRWLLYVGYSTWQDSDVRIHDATAQLGYRIDRNWALSVGYRYAERRIDTNKLFADTDFDHLAIGVWYLW